MRRDVEKLWLIQFFTFISHTTKIYAIRGILILSEINGCGKLGLNYSLYHLTLIPNLPNLITISKVRKPSPVNGYLAKVQLAETITVHFCQFSCCTLVSFVFFMGLFLSLHIRNIYQIVNL